MAYIFGDIVTSVKNRVRDSDYDTTEVKEYINDTQADIFNEYRLNFMEASQTYTTVANVADITNGVGLPANYQIAIDLLNTTGGQQMLIPYRDISYLDEVSTSLTSGSAPVFWYMYANTINIYPTPTTVMTVKLRYYKMPTLLVSDSDVPELPDSFKEILVLGAAARVLQVKDNYDQAAILKRDYARQLMMLVKQTAIKQTGKSTQQRINRVAISKRNF